MMKKQMVGAMLAGMVAFGVCADDFKLVNADFEQKDGKISGWNIGGDAKAFTVTSEPVKAGDDDRAIVLSAPKDANQWHLVYQQINLTDLPKTEAGQKLKFTLTYKVKTENVKNGAFATLAFFKGRKRIFYKDSPKINGTNDWSERKLAVITAVPQDATAFQVVLYLGKTTGKAYFADPELEIEVVK